MKQPYVYCICYLDTKYYHLVPKDLLDKGFSDCKSIIPTVKILYRASKNKTKYREVPILFNYGFIKIPTKKAYDRDFIRSLSNKVRGIRGFMKAPDSIHPKKKKARVDNMDIFDDFSKVAIATKKEVRYFQRQARQNKRFSTEDLTQISIGDYIILKGYPYDGIEANVLDINYTNQTVKLLLYPENGKMELTLPFDSVIYSVYQNYDPDIPLTNSHLWDGDEKKLASITQEGIDNNYSLRRRSL